MARRYEDTIDAVMRMPEEHRGATSWVMLAGSYGRLGRTEEAAEAKAKLLKAFPNVSAERVSTRTMSTHARRTRSCSSTAFGSRACQCMTPERDRGVLRHSNRARVRGRAGMRNPDYLAKAGA